MRWFIALTFLCAAFAATADEKPHAPSDLLVSVTSKPVWLNTSRPLTPEDLQGRILLLDFWTLGCINCMDIIPDLKNLEREFGSSLTVIGVHSAKFADEKQIESIRAATMRYGLTHPVVSDADFTIWNTFGVRAWPTLVLLNPEGKIASVYAGEDNTAALEKDIHGLLEKYKGAIVTAALPLASEASKQADTPLRFPGKVIAADSCSGVSCPTLYIADSGHNRIVVMKPDGNVTLTIGDGKEGLKDGSFEQVEFYKPQGMAYRNGLLYVADLGNHALRLVNFAQHTVTTLAGTGVQGEALDGPGEHDAAKTPLSSPWDVAFYPEYSMHLAIAMAGAHQLWSYDIDRHTVSLLAGNGQEALDDGHSPFAALAQPSGLLAIRDTLYFTDAESSALRKYTADGNVTTLVGKGLFDFGYREGGRDDARLQHPLGLTGDAAGLYIADTYNHSIRLYDITDGTLHNFAGHNVRGHDDGPLAQASFNEPGGMTSSEGKLYVADTNNNSLRAIDLKAGTVSTPGQPVTTPAVAMAPAAAPPLMHTATSSGNAPNLSQLSFVVGPDMPIDVTLTLASNWHVNDTAPSQLTLLDKSANPLLGFGLDMIKTTHLRLPPLKGKTHYHLDGIVYYCADGKGALCMIKSLNVMLLTTGKGNAITLPVN